MENHPTSLSIEHHGRRTFQERPRSGVERSYADDGIKGLGAKRKDSESLTDRCRRGGDTLKQIGDR